MSDIVLLPDERLDAVNEKITLIQKKDGLTFGTDAFLLASFVKGKPKGSAAELGTGTGIISLLLAARNRFSRITAFEIQESFAEMAKRNAEHNSLDGICRMLAKDIRQALPADTEGEVDVVFANPPYMKTDSGKRNESDAKYIARHEVCGDVSEFCRAASRLLKHGGKFYVVWRPDRLCDLIHSLRQCHLEPKVITFVHGNRKSEPSMVLISATKGGASSCRITPPLFLFEDEFNREQSAEAKKIYDNMSFDGVF